VASIALLPALAACSASTPADYATGVYPSQSIGDALKDSLASPRPTRADGDYTAEAYPSQSIGDALKGAPASPPPRAVGPPAPPNSSSAVAGQPGRAAPSSSAAAAAPAPSAPRDGSDASAYPSVSLSDLLFGPPKPAPR